MRLLVTAALIAGSALAAGVDRGRETWLSVANRLIATQPEQYPFDWGEGVQMTGLMHVYDRVSDPRYVEFVEKWAAFHMLRGLNVLLMNTPDTKRQGYCGTWICGNAFALLYEAKKNPDHLKIASGVVAFIRAGATRSPEGVPGHWTGNYQIWVDTLFMTSPLLSRMSKLEGKPAYVEDAANQLLMSAKHMRDVRTGLFYHMWDWQNDTRSDVQWGRGNGWIIMSIADTLEYLPQSHASYKPLKHLANEFARSLVAVQDRDGLLHTVLDDPGSYPECSASTMLTYGLLKLVRLGVLPQKYREPATRAWTAVNTRWVKDGLVTGVSAGTGTWKKDRYVTLATGTYTWGTGAYLLAGAEMDRWQAGR